MSPRPMRIFRFYLLALALVPLGSTTGRLEGTSPDLVAQIVALQSKPLADIWPAVEELRRQFHEDRQQTERLVDEISTLGEEVGDKAKLAGAALLYNHSDPAAQRSGQGAIQQIARASKKLALRIAAIRLLQKPVARGRAVITLQDVIKYSTAPKITIEASLAYWKLDNYPRVRDPILPLLEDRRPGVAYAAALALAETGYLDPAVEKILRTLREEPSERGKLAELRLRTLKRETPLPRHPPIPTPRPPTRSQAGPWSATDNSDLHPSLQNFVSVLVEVVKAIYSHHLQREKIELRELATAAVKGVVAHLDRYSSYQDPLTVQRIGARTLGSYWGLGATLVKPVTEDAPCAVEKVHPGGPASRAGIRPSDRILEIDGVTTHNRNLEELELLKPQNLGDEVSLRILRWGWRKPRTFRVKTGRVEVPATRSRLLPGNIGYIKILDFRLKSAAEFTRTLDKLESRGLEALILDLRNNRGGRLDQAVAIVDEFVDGSEAIVTERALDGTLLGATYASVGARSSYPIAVLVNKQTASAAEVVAGALQDFLDHAVVIGKRTFGKGVTQVELPLSPETAPFLGGESRLLLTTKKLHRPSGRSLQQGVTPDIEVQSPERPDPDRSPGTQQAEEILRVQYSTQVDSYLHFNYAAAKDSFETDKTWDPSEQLGFMKLYDSLKSTLSPSQVSQAIRQVASRHFGNKKSAETVRHDLEDKQIVRGILELLKKMGRAPGDIAEYQAIAR